MDLQLVTDYRNLRLLLQAEIREALRNPKFSGLLTHYDFNYLMFLIETAWVKDVIESTALLIFGESTVPLTVYTVFNEIDRTDKLRSTLYRQIIACDISKIPEGELSLVLRPTGLYLYLLKDEP